MDTPFFLLPIFFAVGSLWYFWKQVHCRSVNIILENIPGPTASSFLTGSLEPFFNRFAMEYPKDLHINHGPVIKLRNFLNRPMVLVGDPKALHTILIKEEHIFEEPDWFIKGNLLVFGEGLVSTLGEQHRKQRKILNPVFSVKHMRSMLPMFYSIIHKVARTQILLHERAIIIVALITIHTV